MVRPANLGLMVLFGLGMGNVVAADPPPPLGSRITELALQQADGQPWNWTNSTRDAKAVAVVFLGTECPASNAYIPSLNRLAKMYADQGVLFVGLYANEQDDLASISRHAKDYKRGFLGLKDPNGEAAKKFAAERVPTAFVLDAARTVRYRGRIDDQYERGVMRPQATANELRDALEAVLAGQEVKVSNTSVIGCPINFGEAAILPKKPTTVTYSQQVARILQNHCVECHRPGEAAPFQLLNYKQAKAWSGAIREVVSEGIMPPWHADPKHGQFLNDRRLPEAEKKHFSTGSMAAAPKETRRTFLRPRPSRTAGKLASPMRFAP